MECTKVVWKCEGRRKSSSRFQTRFQAEEPRSRAASKTWCCQELSSLGLAGHPYGELATQEFSQDLSSIFSRIKKEKKIPGEEVGEPRQCLAIDNLDRDNQYNNPTTW